MRKILLILVLISFPFCLSAQDECAFILAEAQDMFNAGLIETIPDKLSRCLDIGFTSEEKLQAYKLIILSYLFDDNIIEAEKFMLLFLSDYPSYESVATDPREFVALMETYDTSPVLMIGGSLGTNFSFPLVTGRVGIYNFNSYLGEYAPGGAAFHGAFRIERRLAQGLDFTAEVAYNYNRFDFYLDNDIEPQPFSGEITDFSKIEYYETQNRINLPFSVCYNFDEGVFSPTATFGISPGILFLATGEGFRDYENTGDKRYDPVPVAGVNILPMRRIFNTWAFLGAGFKYSLGPGVFFMDARFYVNLQNQVRPGSNRFIQKLAFESFYVSDNLLLNNLAISAGYMFPIYQPKKKEE